MNESTCLEGQVSTATVPGTSKLTTMPQAPYTVVQSRPMGWGELLWWRVSEAGSNNGIMVLEVEGRLELERLRQAVSVVAQTYPLLRARGVKDGSGGRIEVMSGCDVPLRAVERQGDKHWIDEAEREVNERVPHDAHPMWRVVLVAGDERSEVIFAINHAIVDGISANYFFDQMLRAYAGLPLRAATALPPPFDEVIKPTTFKAQARYTWRYVRGMFGRQPTQRFALASNVAAEAPGRSRLVDFTLDEATTTALIKASKAHGVNLNNLLTGAMLQSASSALVEPLPHRLSMSFALSLRGLLKVNVDDDFGYYVTGAEVEHEVAQGADLWALAKGTAKDAAAVYHGEHVRVTSWLRAVILKLKPTGQSLLDAAPKSSRTCFHITNMGRLDMPTQYGSVQVRRWFHSSSVHLARRPFLCLSSIAYGGRLQLTFGYCEPHLDRALVDRVLAHFIGTLNQVAKGAL